MLKLPKEPKLYDVAILGGTPAGFAGGYCLARRKRRVVVIDSPAEATECPLDDWVGGDFFDMRNLSRSLGASCRTRAIGKIIYHSADLLKSAETRRRGVCGYLLSRGDLVAALRESAEKAGAKVHGLQKRPRINLREDSARISCSAGARGSIDARLLIVVSGSPGENAGELSMPAQEGAGDGFDAVGLNIPARGADAGSGGVLHVVAPWGNGREGLFFRLDKRFHLRLICTNPSTEASVDELSDMLRSLQSAGLAPKGLPVDKAQGARWRVPAGAALGMDTHVAKRCLLAGTAGGFAETMSAATITPSVRSAILAAKAADAALDSTNPQEELMKFERSWRRSLADYLCPPSASLEMLFPLLFCHPRMVRRFTDAFLYGKTI